MMVVILLLNARHYVKLVGLKDKLESLRIKI